MGTIESSSMTSSGTISSSLGMSELDEPPEARPSSMNSTAPLIHRRGNLTKRLTINMARLRQVRAGAAYAVLLGALR